MASEGSFVGCVVKVDCGVLGIFEGRVANVDAVTLNLEDGKWTAMDSYGCIHCTYMYHTHSYGLMGY